MIVVADGDIATKQVSQQQGPMPMGYNFYTRHTFANKDFFLNSIEYLVNPSDILETRAKDYTLRLLDPLKQKMKKALWQFINIVVSCFTGHSIRIYLSANKKKKILIHDLFCLSLTSFSVIFAIL